MEADERDKRARVVTALERSATALGQGASKLANGLEAGDFYAQAGELVRGVTEGARNAGLGERGGAARPKRLGELLGPALERFKARVRGDEKPVPLPWPSLAERLGGGLWPGAHVLVGSTGTGKTQLQLQLALHAARAGVPVLYIGLELGELDTMARLIALLDEAKGAGVRFSDLMRGAVPEERFTALAEAAVLHLAELGFELETGDAHGWDYTKLVPAVRALRERYGLDGKAPVLVVLDYLQLVDSPEGKREELRERIGRAAYQAREAARHAGAAVLVTSSLARTSDKLLTEWGRAWPEEKTADGTGLLDLVGLGKEAGEVEFSADTVIVMARTLKAEGEAETRVRLGVPKQRNGGPGELTLCFNGSRWVEDTNARDAARKALAATKPNDGAKAKPRGNAMADKRAGDDREIDVG